MSSSLMRLASRARRKGPALPSPSLRGQEYVPHAGPAPPCVRAPAPPRCAHALRGPAIAHFSPTTGGARARSSSLPPHSPLPHDLLFCLQTPPPASSSATRAPPPGPPAFHPGPRSTQAACRRMPGGREGGGGDLPPHRDPARVPALHPRQTARALPGGCPPPERASAPGSRRRRRRARAAQVKEEKKGGKNRKRRPLQQRSAAGLGQAGRRTREPAIQGRGDGHPGRAGSRKKVAAAAAAAQGRRPKGRVQRAGGGLAAFWSLELPGAGPRASERRRRRRLQEQRRRRRRRHLLLT